MFPIKHTFYALLRRTLLLFVRTHLMPTDPAGLGIDPQQPLCFALADRSLADLLVLEQEALRLGLLGEQQALAGNDINSPCSYVFISHRAKGRRQPVHERPVPRLRRLIEHVDAAATDVQIVPVSIFWGRAPNSQDSLFKILFSDAWTAPGVIRKFFMILLHGRQTFVHFSTPLSLRDLLQTTTDSERAERRVARILRVHFRQQHEAVVGPDLSHRRTLVDSIVRSTPVQRAIEQHSSDSNLGVEATEAVARKYAMEISADYSHRVIRLLEVLLSRLWNRIYAGIRTYQFERLQLLARDNEIIFVPSHRSHIDYLLLSYLLFTNGLAPPHIAAGDNLNMPLVGKILRGGGAFFLRRSFRGNPLYGAVFDEYLHTIICRGFPIEYFVEGGRSRTGRLLSPKAGMLAMTVRSFLRDSRRPIAFVPVYFGYEKILESGSYVSELLGRQKKKESLGGLLGAVRRLRESFGRVHVSFGEAIHLSAFLDDRLPGWQDSGAATPGLDAAIEGLARQVVTQINSAAVVNPVNLVALSLLATRRHVMDAGSLREQIDFCNALQQTLPYHEDTRITETDADEIIEYCVAMQFIARHQHPLGDLIFADNRAAVLLTYFRNNVLHLYALPSLVASFFVNNRELDRAQVHELVQMVYPSLRAELFLRWTDSELPAQLDAVLDYLQARGLLQQSNHSDRFRAAASDSPQYLTLVTLGQAIAQHLQRYYITIRLLVVHGACSLDREELENKGQLIAERLSWLQEFNAPDFFDRKVIQAFISQLLDSGMLSIDESGKLDFDSRLQRADEQARRVLAEDVRVGIIQITAQEAPQAATSLQH